MVLLHIPSGQVFLCNRTGSRIWNGLVNGLNLDSISEEISRDFNAPRAVVRQDTSSFVAELERRGFVSSLAECRT